ncbi:hypothetical protein [Pseudochelatococcus contaminans]|uniref:Uncharacterized protein n=1 Tax=Pseudochelatococcus contaminans TaxID=1538103 RepID=A0A7W5Z415_9HYPH|nr:hypothetical protein [Pseudochelatococcus contaminans]MBB3809770.1 hypothetical protein [Pseudochelatococcus contaminans]
MSLSRRLSALHASPCGYVVVDDCPVLTEIIVHRLPQLTTGLTIGSTFMTIWIRFLAAEEAGAPAGQNSRARFSVLKHAIKRLPTCQQEKAGLGCRVF